MNRFLLNFFLCCFFTFFLSAESIAQNKAFFYQLQQSSGEDIETIYSIDENEDHSLSFYTDQGIFSYDGTSLIKQEVSKEFLEEEFFGSYTDSLGRKWLRTLSGKSCYRYDGEFHYSANDSICKKLDFESILINIIEDEDGCYFFSSINGIKRLSKEGKVSFVSKDIPIVSAIKVTNGEIVLLGRDGLYYQKKDEITLIDSINFGKYYADGLNHFGEVYLSYYNQLFRFHAEGKSMELIQEFDAEIINLQTYDEKVVAISTRAGIYFWNVQSGEKVAHLREYAISSFYEDVQGNFWFSTLKNGLFYTPDLSKVKSTAAELKDRPVYAMHVDNQKRLWLGLDRSEVLVYDKSRIVKQFLFSAKEGQSTITSIQAYENSSDVYVLGKNFFGCIKNDVIDQIAEIGGNDFEFDAFHRLWVCSVQLYCFGKLEEAFDAIAQQSKEYSKSIKRSNALQLIDDQLFVGTQYGAYQVQGDSLKLHHSIDERVSCFSDSFLLTSNGDLYRYSFSNRSYEMFISIDLKYPNAMKEIGDEIYIGSKGGLSILNKNDLSLKVHKLFTQLNVLSIERIDSILFLGTNKGLFELKLPQTHEAVAPLLQFESIILNGKALELEVSKHELDFKQKDLQITLKAVNFIDKVRYEMQLNDQNWVEVPAKFPYKLDEGESQFSFRAINENGISSAVLRYDFVVNPPFWRTWWFLSLAFVFIVFVVFRIISNRVNTIRKENEVQKQIEKRKYEKLKTEKKIIELEQKALRLQMNPHFVFNAINTIKGLYAQQKEREASLYIGSFSKFLRSILDSKDAPVSLAEELEEMKNYVEMNRVNFKTLNLTVEHSPTLEVKKIKIPNLLLQPLVENAIIHGFNERNHGNILIRVGECKSSKCLEISILDDGNGLTVKENKPYESRGTQLSMERLELFNKGMSSDFSIQNRKDGSGVVVTFKLRDKR